MVASGYPVTREGIRVVISREEDLTCCQDVKDRRFTIAAIEARQPNAVIFDLDSHNGDGMVLIESICETFPDMPLLVLSMHADVGLARRILDMGAKGYVLKSSPTGEIIAAIRRVLGGKEYISRTIASPTLRKMRVETKRAVSHAR
jgi:DNA-binding NarL/FixJ family response regulator